MDMGLYIITHKPINNKYLKDRHIMLVGAIDKSVPQGYETDCENIKDNISAKNKNYCELTGLYHMYKNDDSEIWGLEHYRRIFVKRKFYIFNYPLYSKKDIEKIMANYDLIMPKKTTFKVTVYDDYATEHIEDDLSKVKSIIKSEYPEYIDAFNTVMNSNDTYLCNMFIGKSKIIKDYSKWLFDILFKLELQIDISDRDDYQKRVFGFLSERLFTVYLEKHKEIKIYTTNVQMIYNSPLKDTIFRIKNRITKLFHKKG